jgi:lipid-A-disaccharide synthase-like uncharacterized protein
MTGGATFWLLVGFAGQAIFTARLLVQWVESERKRNTVVPVAFWWLSLLGGGLLLAYACSQSDPVIILGQSLGVFVYVRNLMLVKKNRRRAEKARRRAEAVRAEVLAESLPCPVCKRAA